MVEKLQKYLIQAEFVLLCSIAFVFPMYKKILPLVIAVYCLLFVLNGGLMKIVKSLNQKYILITSAYYGMLLLGISYSSQVEAAWFDVEVKFSLLLFPILFNARPLSRRQFSGVLLWFVFGCLAATFICITTAIVFYFNSNDASAFYYQELSIFQHPSYFSLYLNFCIYFIYYYMVFDKENYRIKSDFISVFIIVIFSLFIVLLSSKMGLITLFMVIFTGTLLWFLKSRAIFPSIMVFIMLSSLIYLSFNYSNYIQGRIEEAVNSVSKDKITFTTTGARLVVWKTGLELIKKKPLFGYGTGDVKYELVEKYKEYNYSHLVEHKLNAHNQYIQMLIAIGIFGSIFFWLYLYFPIFTPGFFQNMLYVGFLGLILLNFTTESMLETQAGVVFYAFFNAMLFFNRDNVVHLKVLNRKKS